MIYVYLVLSALLVPLLNNFWPILRQSYSWWLAPVLLVAFFLGFVILHLAWFVLSFAFVSLKSSQDKGAKYYRFILKITVPLIVAIARVKINLSGMSPEEVPTDREMLFVCNHQHDFDPAIIWSTFPNNNIGFIGKKDIYEKMPLIAKVMHKLYGLPLDRENNREAAKTIIGAIKILKEKKASIAVFPEGYTSKNCELLPFRNGAFKIALKANVPIVVCAVNGTRKIPKRMIWRGCEVDFRIIEVIYPEQFAGMTTNEIGDMIHPKMEKALEELKNK
ncbi:MAG: 1-acyl-sn-glycerol-3-phosphate acyltransferase [Ruminococcaceae bacterium]|nr:1-acyl-sn-glycerol-3-phosphate acyltransferase [Oscillospiraceae bacterium]